MIAGTASLRLLINAKLIFTKSLSEIAVYYMRAGYRESIGERHFFGFFDSFWRRCSGCGKLYERGRPKTFRKSGRTGDSSTAAEKKELTE